MAKAITHSVVTAYCSSLIEAAAEAFGCYEEQIDEYSIDDYGTAVFTFNGKEVLVQEVQPHNHIVHFME